MILKDLESRIAAFAPTRVVHKLGAMVNNAIYVNAGCSNVIKITRDAITSELNGVDGLIFLDDDLLPWPALTPANLGNLEELRK
jgi:hypothetical protein